MFHRSGPRIVPYCLADSPPPFSMAAISRGFNKLSSSFPDVSSMHSILYANGSSGSLFPLPIKTSRCFFHISGNIHSLRHALCILSRSSGLRLAISRITSGGMPSSPGASPSLSPTAATLSCFAENGKISVLSVLRRCSFVSSWVGNSVHFISHYSFVHNFHWFPPVQFFHYHFVSKSIRVYVHVIA